MYTTDTIDMVKEKKLLLSISKNSFLKSMIFTSESEKEQCLKYLELKGVAYHTILANYIGFNVNRKIEYKKVAVLYKYDKRIRNILYKFLSAFEEGIRAFISNNYFNNLKQIKLNDEILKNIKKGSNLSKELENLTFSKLLKLSKKLPLKIKEELYGDVKYLESNLKAINELRNVISHHRMLFVYEDFEECFVDGKKKNDLIHNIKNLYNLLCPYYKEFFKEKINNSYFDEEDSAFTKMLTKKAILKI